MKFASKLVLALLALSASFAASATTLTFDPIAQNQTYGDGAALGTNMSATANALTYQESGYTLTLNTPNTYAYGAHIGDANYLGGNTFNWHDSADNGPGAYLTLTATDGSHFNLIGFDVSSYFGSGLTVDAAAHASQFFSGTSHATTNFYNVSSVTFSSGGYNYNALDNIEVTAASAVPEPASLALIGLGLLGAGAARRKSAKK